MKFSEIQGKSLSSDLFEKLINYLLKIVCNFHIFSDVIIDLIISGRWTGSWWGRTYDGGWPVPRIFLHTNSNRKRRKISTVNWIWFFAWLIAFDWFLISACFFLQTFWNKKNDIFSSKIILELTYNCLLLLVYVQVCVRAGGYFKEI